jgi:hypothetical protein
MNQGYALIGTNHKNVVLFGFRAALIADFGRKTPQKTGAIQYFV